MTQIRRIENENDPRAGETGWRIMPSEVAPEGGQPEKTRVLS